MRSLVPIALSALLALPIGACGGGDAGSWQEWRPPEPDGSFVIAVTHGDETTLVQYRDGSEVRIPANPRRVVSTLPGITRTMDELDLYDRLVAISEHCQVPVGREELPKLSVMPLDRETLATLDADLILVDGVVRSADLERLGPGDPPVLRLESRSVRHVQKSVHLLAEVFATKEVREHKEKLDELLARAFERVPPPAQPPLRVLLIAEADPLYVLGPGSLLDDMYRACGCVNIAADLGRPSGPFSEELVLERRPEKIVCLGGWLPEDQIERWNAVLPIAEYGVSKASMWAQAAPSTSIVRLLDLAEIIRDVLKRRTP